jgi:predicted ATPase
MTYLPGFADLINRALARMDRSPSWLAQRIHVNPSTVSRWLNQGTRPGDPEMVVRIADVLGLSSQVQDLLFAAGFGYIQTGSPETTPSSSPSAAQGAVNLPTALTPFLGRERELTEVARLLADPKWRLISIVGTGGMGKTRLAIESGRRVTAHFPDGVFFVSLAALHTEDDLVSSIAMTLRFAFQTDARPLQQQMLDYLQGKSLLLILDNFEHLIDRARLVLDILQTAPRVKVLVTSRERLRLSGERVYPLEGMDFPDGETPADADEYSAVDLFRQSARFVRPDYIVPPADLPYVVRICRRVYGMPLGILLAAAWVQILSLQEISAELDRSLDFLTSDLQDLPERQRSLRAVFNHSWRLLSEDEQVVFRRMSLFHGSFSRQAADEVIGANLPVLTALLNKSLVQRTAAGRFELHPLVRQFAAEKQRQDPAFAAQSERHARYYLAFLRQQMDDLSGDPLQRRLAYITADLENIRAAWEWAAQTPQSTLLATALDSLCRYYELQGRYEEGATAAGVAAKIARSGGDAVGEVNALSWQAAFLRILGDQAKSRNLLLHSRSILEELSLTGRDLRWEEATLSLGFARLARDAGDGVAARRYLVESLAIFEELDDYRSAVRVLGELNYILRNLDNVGTMAQSHQQRIEAAEAARRGVAISRKHNYPVGVAEGLIQLSATVNQLSEENTQALEESLALYTQLNLESGVMAAQCQMGWRQLFCGEYDAARAMNTHVLNAAQRAGNLALVGRAHLHLGMIELADGAPDLAHQHLERSVQACRTAGVLPFLALALCFQGYADRRLGDPLAATQHIDEALRMGLEIRAEWPLRAGIELWALLLADEGNLSKALELYFFVKPFVVRGKWQEDLVDLPLRMATAHIAEDQIATAQLRGEARSLLATVEEILTEIESRTSHHRQYLPD